MGFAEDTRKAQAQAQAAGAAAAGALRANEAAKEEVVREAQDAAAKGMKTSMRDRAMQLGFGGGMGGRGGVDPFEVCRWVIRHGCLSSKKRSKGALYLHQLTLLSAIPCNRRTQ